MAKKAKKRSSTTSGAVRTVKKAASSAARSTKKAVKKMMPIKSGLGRRLRNDSSRTPLNYHSWRFAWVWSAALLELLLTFKN